ncbi:unnamed protein product, partial [Rotaria socialis]
PVALPAIVIGGIVDPALVVAIVEPAPVGDGGLVPVALPAIVMGGIVDLATVGGIVDRAAVDDTFVVAVVSLAGNRFFLLIDFDEE